MIEREERKKIAIAGILVCIIGVVILAIYIMLPLIFSEPEKEVWPFDALENSIKNNEDSELIYSNQFESWKVFCNKNVISDSMACYFHNRISQYHDASLFLGISPFELESGSFLSAYIRSPVLKEDQHYFVVGEIEIDDKEDRYEIILTCEEGYGCDISPITKELILMLRIGTFAKIYYPREDNNGYHSMLIPLDSFADAFNYAIYQLNKHTEGRVIVAH